MRPIKKEKLSDLIFNQLEEMIKKGEYAEGEKLPSENELATFFNVSRVPIREAMSRLVSVGYIESIQGKGSYVRRLDAADAFKQYSYGEFSRKDFYDLLEMRTILEIEAAGFSAERRSDAELSEIKKALDDFKEITNNETTIGKHADYNFHKAIVQSTQNNYLMQTFNNLEDLHRNVLEFSLKLNVGKPRKREEVFEEHLKVYEAIKEQDVKAAKQAMATHLKRMRRKLGDDRI